MDPFVALTTTLNPEGGGYRKPQVAIYANYLAVLDRIGLTPVLVSPAHAVDDVASLVRLGAGLVLSGGEDVEPSRYGEEPSPALGETNPARDEMEWRALEAALERDMPVLGICRGMQLLNVYFGGTLYQDLPSELGADIQHRQAAPWGEHHHEVQCSVETRLHEILGECVPLRINSFHHQAVKELAPNVRCTAQAEDGMVEGIEADDYTWVVGVQWHPERHEAQAPNSDPNIRILEAFAARVREFADG
jgi:putative glutamine amidotransferase